MNSSLFTLGAKDFVKGVITAVFAAIVTTIYGVVSQGDFNLFTADWVAILQMVSNVSFITFIGYIAKNFFTTEEGKFLGKI